MECKVSELVKLGHDQVAELKSSCCTVDVRAVAQLISDLATQLDVQLARSNSLAAENAGLKSFISQSCYSYDGDGSDVCDSYVNAEESQMFPKTPATEAFLAGVRAHDLNAFIRHHSAELDAHIKNGGEQFDEKSVRIRDIIVSARLFREQIRKGVQS